MTTKVFLRVCELIQKMSYQQDNLLEPLTGISFDKMQFNVTEIKQKYVDEMKNMMAKKILLRYLTFHLDFMYVLTQVIAK